MSTPPPVDKVELVSGGCAIGCGLIIRLMVLGGILAAVDGSDSSPSSSRDDCRSRYTGVGDGTVDWRGICDVK
ncbi:hypothetical protein ACFWBN_31660 [Streptomyces sp. NPDC059989]|uniref:hypothetical protein n=1 Tax=Streptomyces sp. NPDC059989 TaxID=3347026 RepID=UPI0036B6E2CF